MKKFLLFAVAALWVLGQQMGGTIVFGRSGDASTLDPAQASDSETFYATTQVYDNLVQFKLGSTEVEPGLASSWDISKDGLEYTFHLKKGVYFAPTKYFKKKVEFTADDVIFSIKRQFDKTHPFNKNATYEYWAAMDMDKIVKDVVKVDKYTVKFLLAKPEAPFLANMAMDFASILCKEYADGLLASGKQADLNRLPVGTGPFVFREWIKDDRMLFTVNKDYWDGRPFIDKLILKVIPNNSVRAAELKTGQIQIMDYPNPEEVEDLGRQSGIELIKQDGMNVGYMVMNQNNKYFKDVRVRQAINHAVDKAAIVKAVYAGLGTVADAPIPPNMWGFNANIKKYPHDLKKARALLKEAGYPNGFSVNLYAMPVPRPYMPNGKKVAQAIQADLAKIGIKVNIVTYDWVTYLDKIKNGEHDMCLIGWHGDNGDPDNFLYTLLSEAATAYPAQNFAFWVDKEFNELITQARRTFDMNERTRLYKKAQEIFAAGAPWVTIANSVTVVPVRSNVKGFVLDPVGKKRFLKVWLEK